MCIPSLKINKQTLVIEGMREEKKSQQHLEKKMVQYQQLPHTFDDYPIHTSKGSCFPNYIFPLWIYKKCIYKLQ